MEKYLKIGNKIYFGDNITENIDPDTLSFLDNPFNKGEILQNHYIKDNKSVFLNLTSNFSILYIFLHITH